MYDFEALLPEMILLATVLLLLMVAWLRDKNTPKTFYTLAKYGVLMALAAEIVLYNQTLWLEHYVNNPQITLFKVIIYLLVLGNMHISLKWFLGEDKSSCRFYVLVVLSLLSLVVLISAVNLYLWWACLQLSMLLNYVMLKDGCDDDEPKSEFKCLGLVALIYGVAGTCGVFGLSRLSGGAEFADILNFVSKTELNVGIYVACALIVAGLLFVMGMAPFHFWMPGALAWAALPASGYVSVVPLFAYYAGLLNLLADVLNPIYAVFKPVLLVFALIAVILGAVAANNENNLRKLFVYSRIFVMGIVLAVILNLSEGAEFSGFVYLLVSILAMAGVYTIFYAFKSKGDYLSELPDVAGVAESKPYVAASMLIFMTSMLGFPPLLGFLGIVIALNQLVVLHQYAVIAVIMCGVLIMAAAYLRVLKTMYFDDKHKSFDRVEKGIYQILLVDIVLIAVLMINPKILLGLIELMLK